MEPLTIVVPMSSNMREKRLGWTFKFWESHGFFLRRLGVGRVGLGFIWLKSRSEPEN
jgi:hypothetical protein